MFEPTSLTPREIASFLAAKSIAAATSFLDGRSDAAALSKAADQLCGELLAVQDNVGCNTLLDPCRLLVVCMMRAAVATGPRQQRWRCIMLAFVDLVRSEATSLRAETDAALARSSRSESAALDAALAAARAC